MQGCRSKILPKYLSVVRRAGLRTKHVLCALPIGGSAAPGSVLGLSPVSRNPLRFLLLGSLTVYPLLPCCDVHRSGATPVPLATVVSSKLKGSAFGAAQ